MEYMRHSNPNRSNQIEIDINDLIDNKKIKQLHTAIHNYTNRNKPPPTNLKPIIIQSPLDQNTYEFQQILTSLSQMPIENQQKINRMLQEKIISCDQKLKEIWGLPTASSKTSKTKGQCHHRTGRVQSKSKFIYQIQRMLSESQKVRQSISQFRRQKPIKKRQGELYVGDDRTQIRVPLCSRNSQIRNTRQTFPSGQMYSQNSLIYFETKLRHLLNKSIGVANYALGSIQESTVEGKHSSQVKRKGLSTFSRKTSFRNSTKLRTNKMITEVKQQQPRQRPHIDSESKSFKQTVGIRKQRLPLATVNYKQYRADRRYLQQTARYQKLMEQKLNKAKLGKRCSMSIIASSQYYS